MLDTLITSKTRVKLLLKFFLNPEMRAYLRGLSEEFGDSTNSIRLELNRLESAGMLVSEESGARKVYRANTGHPFFPDIQRLMQRYTGLDRILETVVARLEGVDAVYITGDLAKGKYPNSIELVIEGVGFDESYVNSLCHKAQTVLSIPIFWKSFQSDSKSLFQVYP